MKHARADYQRRIVDVDGIIPAEEPVFLIRAQDHVGALVVRQWAALHEAHGGDYELARMARAQADAMDQWPVKKAADL
jgi:hypothetical protein